MNWEKQMNSAIQQKDYDALRKVLARPGVKEMLQFEDKNRTSLSPVHSAANEGNMEVI